LEIENDRNHQRKGMIPKVDM